MQLQAFLILGKCAELLTNVNHIAAVIQQAIVVNCSRARESVQGIETGPEPDPNRTRTGSVNPYKPLFLKPEPELNQKK